MANVYQTNIKVGTLYTNGNVKRVISGRQVFQLSNEEDGALFVQIENEEGYQNIILRIYKNLRRREEDDY